MRRLVQIIQCLQHQPCLSVEVSAVHALGEGYMKAIFPRTRVQGQKLTSLKQEGSFSSSLLEFGNNKPVPVIPAAFFARPAKDSLHLTTLHLRYVLQDKHYCTVIPARNSPTHPRNKSLLLPFSPRHIPPLRWDKVSNYPFFTPWFTSGPQCAATLSMAQCSIAWHTWGMESKHHGQTHVLNPMLLESDMQKVSVLGCFITWNERYTERANTNKQAFSHFPYLNLLFEGIITLKFCNFEQDLDISYCLI